MADHDHPTKVGSINSLTGHAKICANLDVTAYAYYGAASNDVDSVDWRGGELAYLTTENNLYVQLTVGAGTYEWRRMCCPFVTTTSTSTSTTTSTTSSTSSTTSTTSSTSTTTTTSSTTSTTSSTSSTTSTSSSTSSTTSSSTSTSSTTTS